MTESAAAKVDNRGPIPAAMDASKRPATAPMPAIAPAPPKLAVVQVAGERKNVQWLNLEKSRFNPRKDFDQEHIANLAESIAVGGIQQNLVVRPHIKTKDVYEIVIGENRYRAIELLIKQGRATPAFEVPVMIRTLTDVQVIETALIENLQRKDLKPMEEAEGFKALRATLSTAEIAMRVGFSQRYVQQRLALVENLTPAAQKALACGDIKIETARIISAAPMDRQAEILKEIDAGSGYGENPDDLRELVKDHQIPEKNAAFDLTLYKGAWIPGEADGERFFADTVQFAKLQKAAAETKAEALKKKGAAWVKIARKFSQWEYDTKPNHKNAGAVIHIADDGKLTVHQGLVEKPKQSFSSSAPSAPAAPKQKRPEDFIANAHCIHAAARRTHALQRGVYESPVDAMRVVCLWLLTEQSCGGSPAEERFGTGEAGVDDQVANYLNGLLAKAPDAIRKGVKVRPAGFEADASYGDKSSGAKKATALADMTDVQVTKLFAALVAAGINDEDEDGTAAKPDMVAIADGLGIAGKEEKHGLVLQKSDLEGLDDGMIRGIARDLKIDQWKLRPVEALKKDISALIDTRKAEHYVLPTMRFTADNSKALAALVKDVDAAKPAPAAKVAKKGKK